VKAAPKLLRAANDVWTFFVGLRDGSIIEFDSADVNEDWVTLLDVVIRSGPMKEIIDPQYLTRGLDIPIADIAWVVERDS